MQSIIFLVVLLGCSLSLITLALPVKDSESINSIQVSNTLPTNANITELDQSSKLESTTEAVPHKPKSTTKATPTNPNLTTKNSLNDIPKNSTTEATPRPNGIGTRLSGSLLKILVQLGK